MIFYDMATKVVDTESFPQQNIAGDISGITFVLFSQKPLQWKEINTHTHIQAISMNGLHSQIRTLSKNLWLLRQYKVRKNKTFLLFVLSENSHFFKLLIFKFSWKTRFFFNKKNFYGKMILKNLKTCRKCYENLQPQLQF